MECWTITAKEMTERDFYSLLSAVHESTSRVNPYERRAGLHGRFDLVFEEKTAEEREFLLRKLEQLGLRRVTDVELAALENEPYCPITDRAKPSEIPAAHRPLGQDKNNDHVAIDRLVNEGGPAYD